MNALETRELTYFVAVAEEQHFGRAAQRLSMAQPPLSRAIRQLERRLGVTLFDRTTRSVRLTDAGAVLLIEARRVLAAVGAAERRVRQAAAPHRRLRVVTKAEGDAGLLERILPLYRKDPDAVELDLLVCGTGEAATMLRDGRVDLAFLHTPHDELDGYATEVLLTQEQVAVLPSAHRLADRAWIDLADLAEEPRPIWPALRPRDITGPAVHDPAQLIALVALGQLVAIVPRSVRRIGRTDVAYVPVADAPSTQVVLCWPRDTDSPELHAFRRASVAVAQDQRQPA